ITAVVTRNRRLAAECEAAGISVFRRRRELLREYPPDDVTALLPASTNPEPEAGAGSGRALDHFDRMVCATGWTRAPLLALSATTLPVGAVLAGAILTEAGLFAFVASRARP